MVIGVNTDYLPIDAAFTGTAGLVTGSGTNASFAPGQAVLIHQSQFTNTGQWERNLIKGYSAGTITFSNPLSHNYTTGAQILVLRQYRSVTISTGATLIGKPWNGTTGGILAFLCSGRTVITGGLSASAKGYRGGIKGNNELNPPSGQAGEGHPGLGATTFQTNSYLPNGNGGGGGVNGSSPQNAGAGGGGGHSTAGTDGQTASGSTRGQGGSAIGVSNLHVVVFGGGGGGGQGLFYDGGAGGNGAGIITLFSRELVVTGGIASNGETVVIGNAGGGAGGSILLIGQALTLGAGLITATGGYGSTQQFPNGGNGAPGRIAIARCSASGTSNPAYTDRGYQTYCGIVGRG